MAESTFVDEIFPIVCIFLALVGAVGLAIFLLVMAAVIKDVARKTKRAWRRMR